MHTYSSLVIVGVTLKTPQLLDCLARSESLVHGNASAGFAGSSHTVLNKMRLTIAWGKKATESQLLIRPKWQSICYIAPLHYVSTLCMQILSDIQYAGIIKTISTKRIVALLQLFE